jgi:hypothetical protein
MRLWLASKLNGDFAVKDSFAIQLGDGALSLGRSGQVNEGISDRASGARIGWNGRGLAGRKERSAKRPRNVSKRGKTKLTPGSP